MRRLASRRQRPDFWPGFVDALAALLMVMIFVILIFVIGQFVLADAVSGRDQALQRLHSEIEVLARTLGLESEGRERAERLLEELRATLASERSQRLSLSEALAQSERSEQALQLALTEQQQEAARLAADVLLLREFKDKLEAELAQRLRELESSQQALSQQAEVSDRALVQVEMLNRQLAELRYQLDELQNLLAQAERRNLAQEAKIEELGRELNLALVAQVRELNRYRSEFFGRLRQALGEREDIRIVGDRFVLASEVLFATASDEVSEEGLQQLNHIAGVLRQLAREIPDELPWVLQVDGHTDRRPIATERFPSNWELSTARAVAIVKYLREQGVPAQRLAATGYGEYHPVDPANTPAAHARNRRIELKLTNR